MSRTRPRSASPASSATGTATAPPPEGSGASRFRPGYDLVRGRSGNAEQPLVGDADGDGDDSIGITFYEAGSGSATGRRTFEPWLSMEPGGQGLVWSFGEARPSGTGGAGVLGDWNGDGTDTGVQRK